MFYAPFELGKGRIIIQKSGTTYIEVAYTLMNILTAIVNLVLEERCLVGEALSGVFRRASS